MLISNSSSLFSNSLGTVLSTSSAIGIPAILVFHSVLSSPLARSNYLYIFSLSFIFTQWSGKRYTPLDKLGFFFLLINTRFGLLIETSIPKSQRILCILFSRADSSLCKYCLVVWSMHNSQRITISTQSSLVLCCFCARMLHQIIMWSTVSFLLPHNLHLLFCWVYLITILFISLILVAYSFYYYYYYCLIIIIIIKIILIIIIIIIRRRMTSILYLPNSSCLLLFFYNDELSSSSKSRLLIILY